MTFLAFRLIFLSAASAVLLAPLAVRLAVRYQLIDIPGSLPHKKHERPVPLAGGWVLLVVSLLVGWQALTGDDPALPAILAMSVVVFIFGVIDDRVGLGAPVKLVGQGIAGIGLIWLGVQVRLLPAEWNWLNILITLIWLVGITNAFNFVDSMDGLALGLAGLAAAFFMLVTQDAGQPELAAFSAALLGSTIGLYYFNARPARVFLGDAGSQWLGFVLAGIGIAYTPQGFLRSQSWFVPILLVGVPIFDTTLILISRLRRGLPWYKANMDHTYHRMVRFGADSGKAVLTMHLAELMLSCLAFILLSMPVFWANLVFGLVLLLGMALILWMDNRVRWA